MSRECSNPHVRGSGSLTKLAGSGCVNGATRVSAESQRVQAARESGATTDDLLCARGKSTSLDFMTRPYTSRTNRTKQHVMRAWIPARASLRLQPCTTALAGKHRNPTLPISLANGLWRGQCRQFMRTPFHIHRTRAERRTEAFDRIYSARWRTRTGRQKP